MEALLLVVKSGPTMLARIALLRALNRDKPAPAARRQRARLQSRSVISYPRGVFKRTQHGGGVYQFLRFFAFVHQLAGQHQRRTRDGKRRECLIPCHRPSQPPKIKTTIQSAAAHSAAHANAIQTMIGSRFIDCSRPRATLPR